MRHHVIISGTGRAGTTFLMQVLSRLGLDTGYRPEDGPGHPSQGGLECDPRRPQCPYIIKWPMIGEILPSLKNVAIDHLFVPIRNLFAAAESRRAVTKGHGTGAPGALWGTESMQRGDQEGVLLRHVYSMLFEISRTQTPVTFLHYPRLAKEPGYLFPKLKPILKDTPYPRFEKIFRATLQPGLIHTYGDGDR